MHIFPKNHTVRQHISTEYAIFFFRKYVFFSTFINDILLISYAKIYMTNRYLLLWLLSLLCLYAVSNFPLHLFGCCLFLFKSFAMDGVILIKYWLSLQVKLNNNIFIFESRKSYLGFLSLILTKHFDTVFTNDYYFYLFYNYFFLSMITSWGWKK